MTRKLIGMAVLAVFLVATVGCQTTTNVTSAIFPTKVTSNQKVELTLKQTGSGEVMGTVFVDKISAWGPEKVPGEPGATLVLHEPTTGGKQLTTGKHTVHYLLVPDAAKPGQAQVVLKADGNVIGKPVNTVGAVAGQKVEGDIHFTVKAPGK